MGSGSPGPSPLSTALVAAGSGLLVAVSAVSVEADAKTIAIHVDRKMEFSLGVVKAVSVIGSGTSEEKESEFITDII